MLKHEICQGPTSSHLLIRLLIFLLVLSKECEGLQGQKTHLIVNVQGIRLALGAEVLCVPVHSEIHMFANSLQEDGVPVLVVQQAPQGGRGGAAAETRFAVICKGNRKKRWHLYPQGSLAINRIFCKQGQLSLSKVKDDSLSTDPELSWAWDGIPTFSHRFQDQVLHQLTSTLPFRHERTCFQVWCNYIIREIRS